MIWMQERIVFQDCLQTLYSARGGVFWGRGGENHRNGKKTAVKAFKRFLSGHGSGCGRLPRRPAAPWVPGTRDMPAAPLAEKNSTQGREKSTGRSGHSLHGTLLQREKGSLHVLSGQFFCSCF